MRTHAPKTFLHFVIFVTFVVSLSGCVTAKDFATMLEAAGKDNASVCGALIGGVAAMSILPGAAVPVIPGGGYYGKASVCRTNQPGTTIVQGVDGSLTIQHGVYKQDIELKQLQELEEKLSAYERALSFLLKQRALEEEKPAAKQKEGAPL